MDVQMPDGTLVRNVPEGMTKAALTMKLATSGIKVPKLASDAADKAVAENKAPGALETFTRGVIQGATANLGDEVVAGGKAITGNGDYDTNLQAERDRIRAGAKENPVSDIAGNIVGSIAGPGKFVKKARGVVDLIKQGAIGGAIYGAGAGEGGIANRGLSALEGATIGAGTGAVLGGAGKIIDKVRPSNISARYTNEQFAKSPMTAESDRLSTDLGQVYTPGQATGSRGLLTIEGLVRRHPASADKMAQFDAQQLDRSLGNLVQNLDRLHANPSGPEATGNLVSKSFDNVLNKAVTVRRATANADFGKVDELAGRYRVIKPNNLNTAIDEIAKDFDVPGGGDASASLVKRIQGIKTDLNRAGPEGLSAKETQRLLEVYGNASRGTGKIFQDLDTGQQRMIARKLQGALMQDIDAAADQGGHVGEIATALKTARDNYRSNSTAINDLEKSVLGRLFGGEYEKSPERIAQTMRNMQPTELRQSLDILNKADPDTSQSVKRFLVEDALSTAGINPKSGAPQPEIAGEATFSAPKFLTSIRKSPVWGSFTPEEREGMTTAVRDLERISYRAGTDGSPTAPLQFAWELAKALGGGAMAMSPTQVAKTAASVLIPNKIAKVITTPEGQAALRTVRRSKPNTPAALAATSALVGMFVGKDGEQAEGAAK